MVLLRSAQRLGIMGLGLRSWGFEIGECGGRRVRGCGSESLAKAKAHHVCSHPLIR